MSGIVLRRREYLRLKKRSFALTLLSKVAGERLRHKIAQALNISRLIKIT